MDTIGPWELLIIVAVLVALFGASRLPKMARGLGEGIREFKRGISEGGTAADTWSPDPPGQEATASDGHPSEPGRQPTVPPG